MVRSIFHIFTSYKTGRILIDSVTNTTAKPQNWATFELVPWAKNGFTADVISMG